VVTISAVSGSASDSVNVLILEPTVEVSGAPAELLTGRSAELEATVVGPDSSVTWSVDGVNGGNEEVGTIGDDGIYQAPASAPAGGTVTVRASASGAHDDVEIAIVEPPAPEPAPGEPAPAHEPPAQPPFAAPPAPRSTEPPPARPARPLLALSRPSVFQSRGRLYMKLVPGRSGRLIITGRLGRKRFKACSARVQAGRPFTCRLRLPRAFASRRMTFQAQLTRGSRRLASRRFSARVSPPNGSHRHLH
jgi:hypothetical protein